MRKSKKGQYAVPAVLIGIAGMFLIYLFLIYPGKRSEILFDENATELEEAEDEIKGKIIYSNNEKNIRIGKARGETLYTYDLNSTKIAYPEERDVLFSEDLELSANILKNERKTINLNVNPNSTSKVILKTNISGIEGSPHLSISKDGSEVYSGIINNEKEIKINIPKEEINSKRVRLNFELEHRGVAFWATQSIKLENLTAHEYYYRDQKVKSKLPEGSTIEISQSNYKGNSMELKGFVTADSVNEGDLSVSVNKNRIFQGKPKVNDTLIIRSEMSKSGLKIGSNKVSFETEKGGIYEIEDIVMKVKSVETPSSEKRYTFSVSNETLNSTKNIYLAVKIEQVIDSGYINFEIKNDNYFIKEKEVVPGSWNYVKIGKEKLTEEGNVVTVKSLNGRYRIGGFSVIER